MRPADDVAFERKIFYSVTEVAEITGCHRGRVLRWIHRRQMAAIRLDDAPLVPLAALLARLERIEASRARRRARGSACPSPESACPSPESASSAGSAREADTADAGRNEAQATRGQSAGVSQTG